MAAGFAAQALVGLELAQARAEQERVGMLEERQRIAEDLHDHVIQRLFAAGLTLHGVAARLNAPGLSREVLGVVDTLDDTISQIRTSIFALQQAGAPSSGGFRAEVLEVVGDAARVLGFTPDLRFSGPIDARLGSGAPDPNANVAEDLIAVLREALSNVARHAHATRVDVDLIVDDATTTLEVRDNGVGMGPTTRRSGLSNLRARSQRHGGTFDLAPADPAGTSLRWSVPLR